MIDGKKLSKLLRDKSISSEDLSNILKDYGIKLGIESIKKYRTNNVNIPSKTVSAIADILNISEQELYENYEIKKELIVKKELKENPGKYSNLLISKIDENKIDIPYFENSYACAGTGLINYEENPKPITFDKGFLEQQLGIKNFKNMHIIKVKGNSMQPTINSGEFIMVTPFENDGNTVENGAIYVIRYYDDVMIKRVVRNNKTKEVILHSDNKEEHPSINIEQNDIDEFEIIGRVIAQFNFI